MAKEIVVSVNNPLHLCIVRSLWWIWLFVDLIIWVPRLGNSNPPMTKSPNNQLPTDL
jgi:hypothetical protein